MSGRQSLSWAEANQAYLVAEFAALGYRLGLSDDPPPESALRQIRNSMQAPSAIDTLTQLFELTSFEREILLLTAGVEMDSEIGARYVGREAPVTFGLAMGALTDPHWSALTPERPLRRLKLIDLEPEHGLTSAPLRINERILHYLAGINVLDSRLEPLLRPLQTRWWIAQEHDALAREIARDCKEEPWPFLLDLSGDDPHGQQDIASQVAEFNGYRLFVLRAEEISSAADADLLLRLWTREASLLGAILMIAASEAGPNQSSPSGSDAGSGPGLPAAARLLIERLQAPLIMTSRDALRFYRRARRYQVDKPLPSGQKRLWQRALGSAAMAEHEATAAPAPPRATSEATTPTSAHLVDELAGQFRLSAETIFAIAGRLAPDAGPVPPSQLWDRCRALSRPRLEALAQRMIPVARWDDLVLPPTQKDVLRQLAAQVRNRTQVYEEWGFAAKGRRGLGISGLFTGPSGTGKTMAAEVLADELRLDLYRIDLSAVVSKYIGETEKNLRQLFDAAEEGGVILLFDEADALFGKRAEVKDSHDRYANIEVGYLLQRIESYQGLAILTTNLPGSMDKAFQRRLRFNIDFPFPDPSLRKTIWTQVFPAEMPRGEIDPARLAQLNLSGGSIRNIALNAAFLAAESAQPLEMQHLLKAAQWEAVKTGSPISQAETRGWS